MFLWSHLMKKSEASQAIGIANLDRIKCLINKKETDHERWSEPINYSTDNWDYRLPICLEFISGSSSIIDFGCGNTKLKSFLPEGTFYQPIDLVARTSQTLIIDGNTEEWYKKIPEKQETLAAIGVIEYIHDCKNFIYNASLCADKILITYHLSHSFVCDTKKEESNIMRLSNGWLSDFNIKDFLDAIEEAKCRLLNFHCFPLKKYYQEITLLISSN